jgi:hypothetical protein
MAKQIKTRVNYQVTELVNNLNEAATAQSEQKRDYFTTRALYNAKRLESLVRGAKIGAMALVIACGMMACNGGSTSTTPTTDSTTVSHDSTSVTTDSTHTDSTKAVVTDSNKAGK